MFLLDNGAQNMRFQHVSEYCKICHICIRFIFHIKIICCFILALQFNLLDTFIGVHYFIFSDIFIFVFNSFVVTPVLSVTVYENLFLFFTVLTNYYRLSLSFVLIFLNS